MPRRPANSDLTRLRSGAQADQQPGVMGGSVASAAFALADDGPASGQDLDTAPTASRLLRVPTKAEANPVVCRPGVVAEQGRGTVLVIDDHIDVAVVVEDRRTRLRGRRGRRRSRRRRRASPAETAVPLQVAVQQGRLGVWTELTGSGVQGCRRHGRWRRSNRASRRCRNRPGRSPSRPREGCRSPCRWSAFGDPRTSPLLRFDKERWPR